MVGEGKATVGDFDSTATGLVFVLHVNAKKSCYVGIFLKIQEEVIVVILGFGSGIFLCWKIEQDLASNAQDWAHRQPEPCYYSLLCKFFLGRGI